jgi:hypothetical protein
VPQDADPPDDAPWPLAASSYGSQTAPTAPNLTSNLAQAIGYSLDTLAANRAGQISEGQISDLKDSAAKAVWLALLEAGLFLLFFGCSAQMGFLCGKHDCVRVSPGPATALVLLIGVIIVCVGLLPAVLRWTDIRSQRAVMVEGLVTRERRKSSSYFHVNNLEFRVPTEAYDALEDGRSYRVYYTLRSKTLLSIEPI